MNRIARDLGVDPRDLWAATARAVAAFPFVFAGILVFMALLVALVPGA